MQFLFPVYTWVTLITSSLIIATALLVLIRILLGSRSQFAIKLSLLTIVSEISSLRYLVIGHYYYVDKITLYQYYNLGLWTDLAYYFSQLQYWVLAMQYLQTAITCSQDPIMTLNSQKCLNYVVVFVYCSWFISSCLY